MTVRIIRRFIHVIRVLHQYRVLHLILALWPSESLFLRIAQRFMPHTLSNEHHAQDASNLRQALEHLGPIFIKLGQILSTRPDLLPAEYIIELSQLQDNISPVPTDTIRSIIEQQLKSPIDDIFNTFNNTPVATASVAQVHQANMAVGTWAGRDVAVKVLRPNIKQLIQTDIACMYYLAGRVKKHHTDGERLRPTEVVAQIEQHLKQELNLQSEAANTSVLHHNFTNSELMFVPEICWDYCTEQVMLQEWMVGVPVSQLNTLTELNIDRKRLARDGVEIFFTQVFRDGFFHADMHLEIYTLVLKVNHSVIILPLTVAL